MTFNSDSNNLTASVIVPVYNAEKTIQQCLQAIVNQNVSFLFEIIAVDDGSSDHSADIIRRFDQVRYVRQDNKGPAAARNKGAQLAHGRFLVFTDSDCIPKSDWLAKLLAPVLMGHAASAGRLACAAGGYDIANSKSILARCVHAEIRHRHLSCMPTHPRVFGSFNCAIVKDVFEEVGGFDEHFPNASGEDNDLSYRLIKAGWKIVFVPDALVAHHHPERLGRYLYEQFRHGYWRARLYARHPEMMKGDDYTMPKDIADVVLCLMSFGMIGGAGSGDWARMIAVWSVTASILLIALQGWWAVRILGFSREALYFSGVLLLRAYARTIGLTAGVARGLMNRFLHRR